MPVLGATGYVRTRQADKPKLGALLPVIAAILDPVQNEVPLAG